MNTFLRACLSQVQRFCQQEDGGTSTVETVLLLPAFFYIFLMSFETGAGSMNSLVIKATGRKREEAADAEICVLGLRSVGIPRTTIDTDDLPEGWQVGRDIRIGELKEPSHQDIKDRICF